MDNLNERAARAMGYRATNKFTFVYNNRLWSIDSESNLYFDPEHDRNALHELLQEVGHRGLDHEFHQALVNPITELWNKSGLAWSLLIFTAPASVLCEAAVIVLEAQMHSLMKRSNL